MSATAVSSSRSTSFVSNFIPQASYLLFVLQLDSRYLRHVVDKFRIICRAAKVVISVLQQNPRNLTNALALDTDVRGGDPLTLARRPVFPSDQASVNEGDPPQFDDCPGNGVRSLYYQRSRFDEVTVR